jgi:hypothetical protein
MRLFLTLFRIRLSQFRRIIIELGVWRSMLLAYFLYLFANVLISKTGSWEGSLSVWIGSGLLVFSIQASRPDKNFLKLLRTRLFWIYWLEYIFLLMPVCVAWLFSPFPYFSLFLIISVLPICFWQKTWKEILPPSFRTSFLPAHAFEWKSGIRRSGVFAVLTTAAGLYFSSYTGSIPIALLVLTLITNSFYSEGESLLLLEQYAPKAAPFIRKKISRQLVLFGLISSPLSFTFLVLHFDYAWVLAVVFLMSSLIQLFAVLAKYAFFRPQSDLPTAAMLTFAAMFCYVVPFLAPIPLVMNAWLYRRAEQNLTAYLER